MIGAPFDESSGDPRIVPRVLAAACALAEAHFPTPTVEAAHFLISGELHAWDRYPHLPEEDLRQLGRLLNHRANPLSNKELFESELKRFIDGDGSLCQYALDEDGLLLPRHGIDPCACADGLLNEIDLIRAGSVTDRPIAQPGHYVTTVRVPQLGDRVPSVVTAHLTLEGHHIAAVTAPPHVATAPAREDIDIKLGQVLELAALHDEASNGMHRASVLSELFKRLRSRESRSPIDVLRVRSGRVSVLNAPTGFGKSVKMRVLGSWAIQEDVTIALVVPRNSDVVKLAHGIEEDLRGQGIDPHGLVVPLMSPNAQMRELQRVMEQEPDSGLRLWAQEKLGYGCALPSATSTEREVDTWDAGNEPCVKLAPDEPVQVSVRRRKSPPRAQTCPFQSTCGKFEPQRQACTARVIVTTHANFYQGRVHVPVRLDDGLVVDRLPIEELVMRRCPLIVIDEIDDFQSHVLSSEGRGLTLAWGDHREDRPLLDADTEHIDAFGRLPTRLSQGLRNTIASTRWLAETYINALADGTLGPSARQKSRSKQHRPAEKRWIIPRRWDTWLVTQLRAYMANDPELIVGCEQQNDPQSHHRSLFRDLTDEHVAVDKLPEHVRPLGRLLREVVHPRQPSGDTHQIRRLVDELLHRWVPEQRLRADVTDRLLRRAFLEPLRLLMYQFVHGAPAFTQAGMESVRQIADVLGSYSAWRAIPHGPLGRLMFAFTEDIRHGRSGDTKLSVAAFGGDPHSYVATLGDITSYARCGRGRAVLGLSATAYAPGAHRHHVHVEPTWWVPDQNPGAVDIESVPVRGPERDQVRVSGLSGKERVEATRLMGERLWPLLRNELDVLQQSGTGGVQDRILLASTSYDSCRYLAEGLIHGGAQPNSLVVAVRPGEYTPALGASVVHHEGVSQELPGDRLEGFPYLPGARILIAPLGRAERGLNILAPDTHVSAIGSIWVAIRPIPLVDDPDELLAFLGSHSLANARSSAAPWLEMQRRRKVAGHYFEELVTNERYFRSLPDVTKRAIAAELVISLIQLVGRARRGGTPGRIKLVDHAFIDSSGRSDLPSLIRQLRADWASKGALPLMRELYGTTLDAFFDFADNH
ncbi:hypothetical protein KGD83_16230 [Nocardiopsis akebiae]|uniref:Helicase ATP-binding domain-containing protein n=1 Tax=Nocardiopsis akebiae TaxID=2831968 RepID=A0ABX8BXP7_9ACTN|nr:hypothetical protein [Nocardiopsis akebiae]QUX26911.1 hypothetical protein KGD83_16230 [Nocardiopsis akebiae]